MPETGTNLYLTIEESNVRLRRGTDFSLTIGVVIRSSFESARVRVLCVHACVHACGI